MTERYTMDAQDYYDQGGRPIRDTDILDRLNEQDDDLQRARADALALRTAIEQFLSANTYSTIGSRRAHLRQLVSTDHPGAQMLAELEAGRALRAAVQPLGSMAALTEACAAYDEARRDNGL